MSLLRDKDNGCEWDKEQTFETIAPYTIEEAYEVADAIERSNITDLKEELGDLLLQVVFLSQIAKEKQSFEFNDVVETITEKLITCETWILNTPLMVPYEVMSSPCPSASMVLVPVPWINPITGTVVSPAKVSLNVLP